MVIDSTQLGAFQTCPRKWEEQFVSKLSRPAPHFEFGKRMHVFLEQHYKAMSPVGLATIPPKPPGLSDEDEAACRAMFEAYKAAYPIEPFEVLTVEKYFEIPVPGTSHLYVGKIDAIIRDKATKRLQALEHKTESRSSKRNLPKGWTAKTQGSLYCWAISQLYKEPCDTVTLNVLTKGSTKGQVGPSFRRDSPFRSQENIREAIRDLVYWADQIEGVPSPAPRNTHSCIGEFGWACDYFDLCHVGRSPELIQIFVPTEDYLKQF